MIFFHFEIIINVSVSSFRSIRTHRCYGSAAIINVLLFRLKILMSIRLKTVPARKG